MNENNDPYFTLESVNEEGCPGCTECEECEIAAAPTLEQLMRETEHLKSIEELKAELVSVD